MALIVSFVSGKGGVGKSLISINLSYILANILKYKTLLIDGSLSTPDITFLLNLGKPKISLYEILTSKSLDEKTIKEAIVEKDGINIIQSTISTKPIFTKFNVILDEVIEKFLKEYDYIVIDAAAGLRDETLEVIRASDQSFIVTTPEIHSLYDALRTKVVITNSGINFSGYIVNMIGKTKFEVKEKKINQILRQIPILKIPYDDLVYKSIKKKDFIVKLYPFSKFSKSIFKLAEIITGKKIKVKENKFLDSIKYFVEKVKNE